MHPILIVGAALVGLPVVLHLLLKQEPKKLVFPALRFLRQKQKTSERKMRLRHLLLLLLRCLLIALFALALFQPTVRSTGTINLSGEQPVAAVLLIDTSPSMGYKAGTTTRLDEARRRALDFLDELPKGSRVAVLDPNDPLPTWEPTPLEARKRIEGLKEPAGSAPPVASALAAAYQLLKTVDADAGEEGDPLPRLIAVFSDRTSSCWDASRVEELKKLRDAVPAPAPVQVFFDVGADKPTNVAILSVEMKPQRLSGSAEAVVNVILKADGPDVPSCEVTAQLDADANVQRKEVAIPGGNTKTERFTFPAPPAGFHTVTVKIRDDNLAFDNTRTVTFEVAAKRKVLAVSDDPDTAFAWQAAINAKQEFDCTVKAADPVPDFAGHEAVTLLDVKAPSSDLVKKLLAYVEGGGKLMLIPEGPESNDARGETYNGLSDVLVPVRFGGLTTWEPKENDPKRRYGVPWKLDDDADLKHPLLAPLREFKRKGNVDVFDPNRRRVAAKWREVTKVPANAVVVAAFDNADDPADRAPALIEWRVEKGTVLLLTTRFDMTAGDERGFWNDYTRLDGHSWATLFPWLVMRHLCGSPDDVTYTFPTGRDVTVPAPLFLPGQSRKVIVEGPGIAPADATVELGEKQTELRLAPPKTLSAGVFVARAADEKNPWRYQFSLNTPAEESVLEKVPEAAITELFGPSAVVAVDRDVKFHELIEVKLDRPFELFPALMILVLVFFAFEGLVANRFYKLK